jgi:signal transduction histidine kinase
VSGSKWTLGLGAAAAAALLAWALGTAGPPDPEARFAHAEARLQERFATWRGRVVRAAARLVDLAADEAAAPAALFERAEGLVREEGVDGVAVVDWDNRARIWAGRTFDADPRQDFAGVQAGVDQVDVLDLPAHRVLFAARRAGPAIAVAFLAFDERFPRRRNVAEEVARETGLGEILLRFGGRTVPEPSARAPGQARRPIDLNGLGQATLIARPDPALAAEAARARKVRLHTLLFGGVLLAAAAFFRFSLRRLPPESLLGYLLLMALLAGLRTLLSALGLPAWHHFHSPAAVHPLWAAPGDVALTALVALVCAITLLRAARVEQSRAVTAVLAGVGVAFCVALPRIYAHLVTLLARRDDGVLLFDPVRVWPDLPASLLLGGLCFLTGALFLCVYAARLWARRLHRWLVPLPYLAVALGLLPWHGPWLAACAVLVGLSLTWGGTRFERAMAVTFLAAVASFPLVYLANRDVFVRDVAERARDLIHREPRRETEERLARAVAAMTDPGEGVAGRVAQDLAVGRGHRHLAFRLWAAAQWDLAEPCAVQVWDTAGRLESAFDFDSPPAQWLPAPPRKPRAGTHRLVGREGGVGITFYAHDFELRTIGDGRLVGVARVVVPDRWDVLLYSTLRPSLFREPLNLGLHATSPPVLLAELDPTGTPRRSSAGTTAGLEPPSQALLDRARQEGYASARIRFRGRDARLVLGAARWAYAALVFEEDTLRQIGFVFAKMLLTYSAICLAFGLAILVGRRRAVTVLFRHRVAVVLVLLSVPPGLLLAVHNREAARQRHQERIDERLLRRLDLAETLLRDRREPVDDAWCATLAANHFADINVYRGQELIATSRPGLWDTGLLGRRLAARPYTALVLEDRDDYTGSEFFGHSASLRAAFRSVQVAWDNEPLILGAPALEDRPALERQEAQSNAVLLAIYLMTVTVTVFAALLLARGLTRPVLRLRAATSRVAAGELDAELPEGRPDEFGDLVRAFNRMTRELRETQDLRVRAEKARAWQEMARQVAHEIKNPLTPIKLTIQNLLAAYRENPASFAEEFENGAQLILDQIGTLHRIAGAFSTYAKFPRREPQPVDLNAIMEDVAALYGAAGGSTVVVRAAPTPLIVRADHEELRRALINLVTNSRQARAGEVTLSAVAEDGCARLDVVDDGTGIPPDVQARIFDPAFTTKTSGTGLGLPIVKRIVDDCGGAIEIDSTPGRGTRITIRLPMAG